MTEYIFDVPDENQPIAGESSVYYPDERDAPMIVRGEIVRCKDCAYFSSDELGGYCTLMDFEDVNGMDDSFCSWAERRGE